MDGLSIQVMASNLSALNRSLAEGVTRRSTVDDSANILARRTSTFSAGSLRASTSDFDSGMATGPSCDSGGTALQAVVRVNGLSSTLTARSLSDPSWSTVHCVTDDGAVEERICWLPSVVRLIQRAFGRQRLAGFKKLTIISLESEEPRFRNRHRACAVAPTDGQQVECTILLGCGGCDRMPL